MKARRLAACAALSLVLVSGCGSSLVKVDDPVFLDTAAKLAKCRAEGRAASADAGGGDAGYGPGISAYESCKKREGL